MLADKNNNLTTRERLEFLLNDDKAPSTKRGFANSQHTAFLAGMGLTLLLAGTVLVTHYVDTNTIPHAQSHLTDAQANNAMPKAAAAALGRHTRTNSTDAVSPLETSTGRRTTALASILPPVSFPVGNSHTSANPVTAVVPEVSPPPNNESGTLAQIPGLRASRSVITGVLDPTTLSASYYWTFTLNNSSSAEQEAQMTIKLPDGAVVSRATLWINGRAEEAAFNTTSQVQNAYDWIVTRHRDPLLVTQTENGDVSLKAAPVMPGKEMKLRIGVTVPMRINADGACSMNLPQVVQANLDLGCPQNIHLTSKSAVFANNANMTASNYKGGFLMRGNVNNADMKQLTVMMKRDPKLTRFATRATHSFPQGYIVATVAHDGQGETLQLTKTITKPDCPYIEDNDAAFRLSYLWVKAEIERLVSSNYQQAVQLASVYRVVSPVSGAVVLERKTDYEYNGLDRNMYKSLAYAPEAVLNEMQTRDDRIAMAQPAPAAAPKAPSSRRRAQHSAALEAEFDSSVGNAFASQAVAPQESKPQVNQDAARDVHANKVYSNMFADAGYSPPPMITASASTARHASMTDNLVNLAGPYANWVTSSSRDANLFDSPNQNMAKLPFWLVVLPCIALNFAGGLFLIILAARSAMLSRRGAATLALSGIAWFALAYFAPTVSHILTLLAIPVLLCKLLTRGKRRS